MWREYCNIIMYVTGINRVGGKSEKTINEQEGIFVKRGAKS